MTELSTQVFELDLTSVCVSTGVVQLPMKMQPFFQDGEIAALVDGESLTLEFAGPRRLGGFRSHFEKRGLSANDKLRFELSIRDGSVIELGASCVKRERSSKQQVSRQPTGQDAVFESNAGPEKRADLVDREDGQGAKGSWTQSASTVRAVKRVTIVGTDTLPPLEGERPESKPSSSRAQGPTDGTRARRTSAWQALDGLSRNEQHYEGAGEAEFADTSVRAIRRSSGTSLPRSLTEEHHEAGASSSGLGASQTSRSPRTSVTTEADATEPTSLRLTDLIAPRERSQAQNPRFSPARARIPVGRSPRIERQLTEASQPPQGAESVVASVASAPELIEERELVPVARSVPAAGSSARHQAASMQASATDSSAATLFGMDSSGPELGVASRISNRGEAERRAQPQVVIDDADFGGAFDTPAAVADTPGVPLAPDTVANPIAEPDVGTRMADVSSGSLEDDIRLIGELLGRPDTPAIVRVEIVAEKLAIPQDRCERALDRLAEDRDRISRIRTGAYMIRRDVTKRPPA